MGGQAVRLKGDAGLGLVVAMQYRIVEAEGDRGPWKVSSTSYSYAFRNRNDQEILSFHWHPGERTRIAWPHVHVGSPLLRPTSPLDSRDHIPTGRVSVEEVLRFAFDDLDIDPLKDDWRDIFDRTQAAFEEWRTWP